jgi:hypothetical protein
VEEQSRREHRDADEPLIALRSRHHQRGHRHFGNIEFRESQLPPEQLGRMQDRGNEVDAVRLYLSVNDGPCARIRGDANTELQSHESVPPVCVG